MDDIVQAINICIDVFCLAILLLILILLWFGHWKNDRFQRNFTNMIIAYHGVVLTYHTRLDFCRDNHILACHWSMGRHHGGDCYLLSQTVRHKDFHFSHFLLYTSLYRRLAYTFRLRHSHWYRKRHFRILMPFCRCASQRKHVSQNVRETQFSRCDDWAL